MKTPPSLFETVQWTIQSHRMLERGQPVLVAMSGGPDSVCLCHVLAEMAYLIEIAHLDHLTREGESAADAQFVAEYARLRGLPFHIEQRPIAGEAVARGLSFEAHAREARYEFLARTAQDRGIQRIAVGHTADDQAETVLMRVLRGTGLRGLGGIPPVRALDGCTIIRPLFHCTREAIEHYLQAMGLPWRTDATNADTSFSRNRVRHELLPALRETYNPNIDEALRRLGELARSDNTLLEELTETFYAACVDHGMRIDRQAFASGHPALQRRVLMRFAELQGLEPQFERLEAARIAICTGSTGSACDLGRGSFLYINRHTAELRADKPQAVDPVSLASPGTTEAFGYTFRVRAWTPEGNEAASQSRWASYCTPNRQVFDASALLEGIQVRLRRPGDRLTPLGMSGSKKLKDLLIDRQVPMRERERLPIFLSGGEIIWVPGVAVSAHTAVTRETARIIEIEVCHAPE